jgi:ATP-binding cassette subfamily F protein uup
MSYLNDFLFAPERARSPVKSLSGGERNRLLLARLFAKPANCLVLDEPTNDLDIDTLELLEELLEDYTGTVFLVSHDRTFLDNVVTQVIVAEGEGNWREFVGGYTDWERVRDPGGGAAARKAEPRCRAAPAAAPRAKKGKLSYKEQRELEELPKLIASSKMSRPRITLPSSTRRTSTRPTRPTPSASTPACRDRRRAAARGAGKSGNLIEACAHDSCAAGACACCKICKP